MKNSYPKAFLVAFLSFILFSGSLSAQQAEEWKGYVNPDPIRAHQELILKNSLNTSKVTEFTGSDYDVKFYKLELRLNPDSTTAKYIRGKITTYFTTGTANFNLIKFDMASPLSCDSAYYHGVKLSAGSISKTVDTLSITLPNIPVAGTLDSVSVYYKGVPPVVSAWTSTGFVKSTHGSPSNKNYIYTLSEPYSSYTWWPCKSFQVNDKADSADIIVSTPTTFKVAANGKLISEVTSGSNLITTWQERYPISAYQICVGVANYTVYNSPNVMVGSTSMPVYHYIFPETNTAAAQTALDKTPTMITAFNGLFGDYPFKNEKYGHYTFGFSGGMEHNTFSGMSSGTYNQTSDWDIIAHELGHQWWGGSVTNASWHDIWLHESFADYSERLCAEFAPSVLPSGTTALSWQQMKKTNSISASYQAQSTYVTDTSSILTIFTPSVYIYDRGGMAINMLRKTMGDTKFFQALKNYQADPALKYKTAFTSDMQYHMENVSGLNLTDFFNDWIYGKGIASYNLEWNTSGNNVFFRFTQSRPYAGSPSYFDMPVVIRIQGSLVSQDTTIVAYDDNGLMNFDNNGVMSTWGTNMLGYNLSFAPVTITFDPYSDMLATGTVTKNTSLTSTLPVQFIGFSGKRAGEKAKLNWQVDNSESYALFEVQRSTDRTSFETIGQLTAENQQGIVQYNFTDDNLGQASAYYRIKVITNSGNAVYSKTIYLEGGQFNLRVKVTPNPASENVVISNLPENSNVTVRIIDTRGVVLQQTGGLTVANARVTVPVSDVANGIYFIEVITKDGKSVSQLLVRH